MKKVRELQLPFITKQIANEKSKNPINVGIFGPVYVTLSDANRQSVPVPVNCASVLDEAATEKYQNVEISRKKVKLALPLNIPIPVDEGKDIKFSPVDYPDTKDDHDVCLIGPGVWNLLGMELDTKRLCFYNMI